MTDRPPPGDVADGQPLLCVLDEDLRFGADAGRVAALFGRVPAAGSSVADIAGRLYRGTLPGTEAPDGRPWVTLDRVEARTRSGRIRRVAMTFTRLAGGWLLECRDVTVEEALIRVDTYMGVASTGAEAEAIAAALRDALRLQSAELKHLARGADGAEVPPVPAATAGDRRDIVLRDSLGSSWLLSVEARSDRAAADLDVWLNALGPRLAGSLRQARLSLDLQAERAWTRGVLETASEAVVSLDAAGCIEGFSPAAERMFGGLSAGRAFETLLADEPSSDRQAALADLIAAATASGDAGAVFGDAAIGPVEARAKGGDGHPFEVRLRVAGAGAARTVIFEDVSARHRAEAALERNRSQIVAILDSLRDAVLAVDQELTLVYANDAAAALLGCDPSEIVGVPIWDGADALWDLLGPELFRCIRQREKQELEIAWTSGQRWFDARILPTEGGASVFLLDVTARRRASDLQRESAERYRAVSDLTTDLVFCYRVDSAGMLVREWKVGRAGDILGRELPEQVRAAGLLALVHPHDRTAGASFTQRLLAGADMSVELRMIGPAGGVRWVEVHGKPQRDTADAPVTRILCAIRDISARKRTETALRESEERFGLAVEGAAEGLWDWDIRRGTIFRSERLRGMLGVPAGEDIQRWNWWAEQIHPDDFDGYRAALKHYRASREKLFAAEYRVRHRDGGWRWLLDRAVSRRGADGRVARIVGAVSDISDRKNMELQLKAANAAIEEKNRQIRVALDNISQGLALFDAEDRLTLFNRRYVELYRLGDRARVGVTRKALLEGCIDAGIYASDEVAAVLRKTLGTVGGIGSRHMVQRLADGNVIEVTTTPLPDGGTVATYTNVTPREKREQEMRAARDAAEAANRAKSAFLANMSHELRTPLNAVIGFSDVMKAEMFGPLGNAVYLSYASDIHASGQLLLDLINDILDISKIEAGKAEVAEEVFDLHEVVEASILLCREQAAASSLALRARVAADLPRVRGDARYIRQILLNLVSNAVKFTPSGGRVTVCVWRQAGGGIVLTVADTGIGIPEQMQARVFEPFFQVQSDLARQYQGTGLGLSLVKGLTELHGGRVEIEARRRQGTIFRVRLPAYRNVSP